MTVVLELTPEEEARLQAQAARCGQSVEMMARALFLRGLDLEEVPSSEEMPLDGVASGQALSDSLQEFIGIVDSRMMEPQKSEKSETFTDILVEKARWQGLTL